MPPCRVLALVLLLPAPAFAQAIEERSCSWRQVKPEAFYDGSCTVEVLPEGARVTAGNLRFVIRDGDRREPWSTLELDGKPAVGYRIDGSRTAYATLDLNEFLDIGP